MKYLNKSGQKNWVVSVVALGVLAAFIVGCLCFGSFGRDKDNDVPPTEFAEVESTEETAVPQESLETEPTEEVFNNPASTDATEGTVEDDTDDIASVETPDDSSEPTDLLEPTEDVEATEGALNDETVVYETVYAKTNVNVRSGPGTKYEKLGTLKTGEAVERIEACDNGWSKVIFEGEEAYVSSTYLTTEKPSSTQNPNETESTTPTTNSGGEHKHQYNNEQTVAPTCTEKGFTEHTCSCGYSYKDNEVAATGHSYTENEVAPTYDEKGYTLYTCSVCGNSYKDKFVEKLTSENPRPNETPSEPSNSTENPGKSEQYHCAICGGDHPALMCTQTPPETEPYCGWCGVYGHGNDECTVGQTNICAMCGHATGAENGHYMWVNDTTCPICGTLVPGMTCHHH